MQPRNVLSFYQVDHVHLFMDFRTKSSKGCGFVTFSTRNAAEDAMKVRAPGGSQRRQWRREWAGAGGCIGCGQQRGGTQGQGAM